MKKRNAVLIVLALLMHSLLLPIPSQALIGINPVLSVGGSFLLEPEAVTDNYDAGVAFAAGLRNSFFIPRVSFLFEVGYYRHALDTESFASRLALPNISTSGGDLWIIPVTVIGELDLMGRGATKPFIRIGAGIYKIGITDRAFSGVGSGTLNVPDPSDTAFGTLFGFGLRTPIALGISLFIDATYHVINTDNKATTFLPLRVGVRF